MRKEEWRPVPGAEGRYEVSDAGRVRSLDRVVLRICKWRRVLVVCVRRGRVLRYSTSSRNPYRMVHMGRDRADLVHLLVLTAFRGPRPEGMQCAHDDGDARNNRLENLRWATPKQNAEDRVAHGNQIRGEKSACAKFTDAQALFFRNELRKPEARGRMSGLARVLGVKPDTLADLRDGRTWKHLAERPAE